MAKIAVSKFDVIAIHKTLAEKDIKVSKDICPKCGGKPFFKKWQVWSI